MSKATLSPPSKRVRWDDSVRQDFRCNREELGENNGPPLEGTVVSCNSNEAIRLLGGEERQ